LLYFHRRAWERVNGEDLLRHLLEQTAPPAATPGESPATVLFIDLAGFTPLTVAMGDTAAAEVLRRFAAMVRTSAARTGGRIVKQIGDAFMLTFVQPGARSGSGWRSPRRRAKSHSSPRYTSERTRALCCSGRATMWEAR